MSRSQHQGPCQAPWTSRKVATERMYSTPSLPAAGERWKAPPTMRDADARRWRSEAAACPRPSAVARRGAETTTPLSVRGRTDSFACGEDEARRAASTMLLLDELV